MVCQKLNRIVGNFLGMPYGKPAFHIAAAIYIILIVCWTVELTRVDGGWHEGHTFIWNFKISLWDFSVGRNWSSPKAHQHHGITKLSQQFDAMKMMKPLSLDLVRYQFCAIQQEDLGPASIRVNPWCDFLRRLQLSSLFLLTCSGLGLILMFLGFMACFNFHYVKPRDDHFAWASAYLLLSPLLFSTGVYTYWVNTRDFGALIDESVSIGFLGFGTFGWEFAYAVYLSIASWIPAWIMLGFSFRTKKPEESEDEDLDLFGGFGEDPEADYGSTQHPRLRSVRSPSVKSSSGPNSVGSSHEEELENPPAAQQEDEWHGGQWQRPSAILQAVRASTAGASVPAALVVGPSSASAAEPALVGPSSASAAEPAVADPSSGSTDQSAFVGSANTPIAEPPATSSTEPESAGSANPAVTPQLASSSAEPELAGSANAPVFSGEPPAAVSGAHIEPPPAAGAQAAQRSEDTWLEPPVDDGLEDTF